MGSDTVEMSIRDYGNIVKRRKWVVILATLVSTFIAVGLTALQTPIYSTSSRVLVQPRGQDGLFDDQVANLSDRTINTEIEVIEGEDVRLRVQVNLGLDRLPTQARASAVGQTDVISIGVRDANPANAETLADAYAVAYIQIRLEQSIGELLAAGTEVQRAIDDIQLQLSALAEDDPRRTSLLGQLANFETTLDQLRVDAALRTGGAVIIRSAPLPTTPVEPNPTRTAALAAVFGLVLGLAAAFLVDFLDDKIRSDDDLERATDRAVLAVVPVDRPPDNRPIAISEPSHVAVEAYRGLRTNLQFLGLDRPIKVVQLTSSVAGEGKTTTSTNLAVVLAQAGHRVAIVDADLRRPRVHEVFDVPQSPGFTDLLLGAKSNDVVNHVDVGSGNQISVYTSGGAPSNPSEILSSDRTRQLFAELGQFYDHVIVDAAPILPVSDSVALAGSVDGVFVVVQADRATTGGVVAALERLDRVSAPILGLVLNQARSISAVDYSYGGYGGHRGPDAPPDTVADVLVSADVE